MKELEGVKAKLEAERDALNLKLAPLRAKREALLAKLQPLEAELRTVNKEITKAERERLTEVGSQLAALARLSKARVLKNG